jgi:hypothetical protein
MLLSVSVVGGGDDEKGKVNKKILNFSRVLFYIKETIRWKDEQNGKKESFIPNPKSGMNNYLKLYTLSSEYWMRKE